MQLRLQRLVPLFFLQLLRLLLQKLCRILEPHKVYFLLLGKLVVLKKLELLLLSRSLFDRSDWPRTLNEPFVWLVVHDLLLVLNIYNLLFTHIVDLEFVVANKVTHIINCAGK